MPPVDDVQYTWHPRVHEVWGKERLCFWRIAFSPGYREKAIHDALLKALEEQHIASYAIYQLFGIYDVMVQLWLPTSVSLEAMDKNLFEALVQLDYAASDAFEVTAVERHWPWQEAHAPDSAILEAPLDVPAITAIDRSTFQFPSREDPETSREDTRNRDLAQYVSNRLIAPYAPPDGIVFFMEITRPTGTLATAEARATLRKKLRDICQEATPSFGMTQLSLYKGHGFAEYVFVGRVREEQFHDGLLQLILKVNQLTSGESYTMRAYTFVCADKKFRSFKDRLRTEELAGEDSGLVGGLLSKGTEDQELEFKSSAFADVRRYILGDGNLESNTEVTDFSVLRTVCGFLNSPAGGTLLIGIIERTRMLERVKDTGKLIGARRLEEFPSPGGSLSHLSICGVELDFRATKDADWDQYQQRLQKIVRERITPNPMQWLRFNKETYVGRTLAAVVVRPAQSAWFYVVDRARNAHFYVREGNTTYEYIGPDADAYKAGQRVADYVREVENVPIEERNTSPEESARREDPFRD